MSSSPAFLGTFTGTRGSGLSLADRELNLEDTERSLRRLWQNSEPIESRFAWPYRVATESATAA